MRNELGSGADRLPPEFAADGRDIEVIVDHSMGNAPEERVLPASSRASLTVEAEPLPALASLPDRSSGRASRRLWLGPVVAVVVLAGLAFGSTQVDTAYFALGAGSIRPTVGLVVVEGAESFAPENGIAFATVTVEGPLQAWDVLWSWVDPEVELVHEDLIKQGRTTDETEEANLQLMDASKGVAIRAALGKLGLLEDGGAQIVEVIRDAPAFGVLEPGDVVVSVDGRPLRTSDDFLAEIAAAAPNETLVLGVLRTPDASPPDTDGAVGNARPPLETVDVHLGEDSADASLAYLGVRTRTWEAVIFPEMVTVESGAVGGPSAGLAFALGTIDVLTPGELVGHRLVAATGTIDRNGAIGPVGGIDHKAVAARDAGVSLFLVPASQTPAELAKARSRAGESVEIVPVESLDDAILELAERGGEPLLAAIATPAA